MTPQNSYDFDCEGKRWNTEDRGRTNGKTCVPRNADIDDIIRNGICGEESEYIEATASALSKELLYMKFVQGIPLVGAVGGAYDAVCMNRVQRYASSKYRRRYLYEHAEELLL